MLGIVGACFEVLLNPSVTGHSGGLRGNVGAAIAHPVTLAAGLAMTAVCLLVGSAVGALCNPPLLRHPATAMLATLAAAVFALASDVSPAGAALRHASNAFSPHWPGAVQVLGAACLLAVTWTASVLVAARREQGRRTRSIAGRAGYREGRASAARRPTAPRQIERGGRRTCLFWFSARTAGGPPWLGGTRPRRCR